MSNGQRINTDDSRNSHSFHSLQPWETSQIVDFQASPSYALHLKKQMSKIQLQIEEDLDERVSRLEKLLTNKLKWLVQEPQSWSNSVTKTDIK